MDKKYVSFSSIPLPATLERGNTTGVSVVRVDTFTIPTLAEGRGGYTLSTILSIQPTTNTELSCRAKYKTLNGLIDVPFQNMY